jgi:hypothetical protein
MLEAITQKVDRSAVRHRNGEKVARSFADRPLNILVLLICFAVAVSWHSETISDESSNEHLLLLMCCQVQLFIRLDSLYRPVWSHCRLPGQWVVTHWTDPLLSCRE